MLMSRLVGCGWIGAYSKTKAVPFEETPLLISPQNIGREYDAAIFKNWLTSSSGSSSCVILQEPNAHIWRIFCVAWLFQATQKMSLRCDCYVFRLELAVYFSFFLA